MKMKLTEYVFLYRPWNSNRYGDRILKRRRQDLNDLHGQAFFDAFDNEFLLTPVGKI